MPPKKQGVGASSSHLQQQAQIAQTLAPVPFCHALGDSLARWRKKSKRGRLPVRPHPSHPSSPPSACMRRLMELLPVPSPHGLKLLRRALRRQSVDQSPLLHRARFHRWWSGQASRTGSSTLASIAVLLSLVQSSLSPPPTCSNCTAACASASSSVKVEPSGSIQRAHTHAPAAVGSSATATHTSAV